MTAVGGAQPAAAGTRVLYAYAAGTSTAPGCPPERGPGRGCSLAQALAQASAGATVALATSGHAGHYVGNWTVSTPGTSSLVPLTMAPAAGVADPILDGNQGEGAGCETPQCDGPILSIGPQVHVELRDLTIENANDSASPDGGGVQDDRGGTLVVLASTFASNRALYGGAIANSAGGTVMVSGSTFSNNAASDGGAIDNGDHSGPATLTVSRSAFSANLADSDGGAVDNGDNGGQGIFSVSASTFSDNQSDSINTAEDASVKNPGDGGAIDNGDHHGDGHLSVSTSTFSGNSSYAAGVDGDLGVGGNGGAIDDGDNAGQATLVVSGSTLSANIGGNGGAIDNGDHLSVSGSTFSSNVGGFGGGAIDNGRAPGGPCACATVSSSTFTDNTAGSQSSDGLFRPALPRLPQALAFIAANGGAIDNGDGDVGNLLMWSSTFSGNQSFGDGDTIDAGDDTNGGEGAGTVLVAADIFDGRCDKVAGTWHDLGYNVGDDRTCLKGTRGDVDHGATHLGSLAANGGPTQTILPLQGNPALGAVPYGTTFTLGGGKVIICPATDQRGTRSTPGRACDAGAVQVRPVDS